MPTCSMSSCCWLTKRTLKLRLRPRRRGEGQGFPSLGGRDPVAWFPHRLCSSSVGSSWPCAVTGLRKSPPEPDAASYYRPGLPPRPGSPRGRIVPSGCDAITCPFTQRLLKREDSVFTTVPVNIVCARCAGGETTLPRHFPGNRVCSALSSFLKGC